MTKHLNFAVLLFAAGGGAAFAATPAYEYLRTIDLGTTAAGSFRATCAAPDQFGKLYITSNQTDRVGFLNPLTANVPADVQVVYNATSPPDPFGNSSFMGISVDGAGTVFASGTDTSVAPTESNIIKITPNVPSAPTSWTSAFLTGFTGALGGLTATGTGLFGIAEVGNGDLRAYANFLGTTVIQVGSDEPAAGIGDVTMVAADTQTLKGYQSIVPTGMAGRVDVFQSISTYNAIDNPLIDPVPSSLSFQSDPLHYQQISVDPVDKVLCLSVNRGTLGIGNTFQLYDVSGTGKGLTPYQTINGSTTGGPIFGSSVQCYGSAFFNAGGQRYLFIMAASGSSVYTGYVFRKIVADVQDWTMY